MARQAGSYRFTGTVDQFCFYRMGEAYYVRRRSSLNPKKFWKDKAFEGSRKSCKRFSEGNQLASKLYQGVEEEKRVYTLFCFLKKKAILLLKQGLELREAQKILTEYLVEFGLMKRRKGKREENSVLKNIEVKDSIVSEPTCCGVRHIASACKAYIPEESQKSYRGTG